MLRRVDGGGSGELVFGDLKMDMATRDVHRDGRRIPLSQLEFQLLQLFLEHPRQVLTRSTIFERVWGYDFGATSNALGVYIGYLRRKTEEGGAPRLIHTVRGVGYILRDDA
jgi:two-component system response regulator MprA